MGGWDDVRECLWPSQSTSAELSGQMSSLSRIDAFAPNSFSAVTTCFQDLRMQSEVNQNQRANVESSPVDRSE